MLFSILCYIGCGAIVADEKGNSLQSHNPAALTNSKASTIYLGRFPFIYFVKDDAT